MVGKVLWRLPALGMRLTAPTYSKRLVTHAPVNAGDAGKLSAPSTSPSLSSPSHSPSPSPAPGDVVLRPARESDHKGIVELSRIAHGQGFKSDYVPGCLQRFIQDPDRLVYVCEKDGEIISFLMLHMGLDEGRTIQGEAGRSLPDHQGAGVLRRAVGQMIQDVERRYPQWTNFRGSSTQTHFYDNILDRITMLGKRVAFRVEIDVTPSLLTLLESIQTQGLRTVSPIEMTNLLRNPEKTNSIFPDGCIFLNHSIYDAIPSNVSFLFKDNDVFYGSPTQTGYDALSIGGRISANDDLAWRVNFNYAGVIDRKLMLRHLAAHMISALRAPPARKEMYLIVMLPETFSATFGDRDLAEFISSSLGLQAEHVHTLHQYNFQYIKLFSSNL